MITNNALFAALYEGYYKKSSKEGKVAMIEYILPIINRWNASWGDGTFDPLSNIIIKFSKTKEDYILPFFGKGSNWVYGEESKQSGAFFCIAALANFDFDILPSPDIIIERPNTRQYYLYRLEDYDNL